RLEFRYGAGPAWLLRVFVIRLNFDVIESRGFIAARDSFDADLVAGPQRDARNYAPRGSRPIDLAGRDVIRGDPFIHNLIGHPHAIVRCAIVLIEILHAQGVPAGRAVIVEAGDALGYRTTHSSTARRRFPRRYGNGGIAFEAHRLGLDAAGMAADSALLIRNARRAEKPVVDSIAPDLRLAGLILQLCQHLTVALFIDPVGERFPFGHVVLGCLFPLVMQIVDRLDDSLARM